MDNKHIDDVVFPVKVDFEFSEKMGADPKRFWPKVNVASEGECWNWRAAKCPLGYGQFSLSIDRDSKGLAHRVVFGMVHGYLPEAVCHKCDNPSCCNPKHLFGGTRADNNTDKAQKGRASAPRPNHRGGSHHMAKLTQQLVDEIRSDYAFGGVTQYQLAERYSVSQRTIAKAIHGLHVGFR